MKLMNYLTYGDSNNKSVVLIHGMATTAETCFEPMLEYLKDYYVVLVQVDGHIPGDDRVLESFEGACADIERYIQTELGGKVYCIGGLSMGGSMTVEILGRNNIKVEKAFIDAAFIVKMNPVMAKIYTSLFVFFSGWLKKGHKIPKVVYDKIYDSMFGKNNRGIVEAFYLGVKKETIKNVCGFVYRYSMHEEIREFAGKAIFIYGDHEPYARKGANRLKRYLPSLEIKELENMGHGQLLHSYPKMWVEELINYLEK